jgi:hypothetical protein
MMTLKRSSRARAALLAMSEGEALPIYSGDKGYSLKPISLGTGELRNIAGNLPAVTSA